MATSSETTGTTAATAAQAPEATATGAPSKPLPQFTADTVSGGQFDFGSLDGQDALVWFWAPW